MDTIFYISTECQDEWYGFDCKHQCSGHCRDNDPCNKVTGQCDEGCAHGWYGQHCEHKCVGHCINNASCNQANGSCDGGCAAGRIGSFCEKGKNSIIIIHLLRQMSSLYKVT